MQKKSQQERNRPAEIYELKITILDTKPPIWRRVAVPGDVTLAKLHKIIQIVIGWTDSHLHEFRRGGRTYAIPDPGYDAANFIDERRIKLPIIFLWLIIITSHGIKIEQIIGCCQVTFWAGFETEP